MPRLAVCSLVVLLWQGSTAIAQTPSWCAGVDKTQVGALLGGPAPAEAQKRVSADWLKKNAEATATYAEEKGIGDRAFWAVSLEGASSIILKGNKLYLAVLGPGKDAAAQKPGLLKLAQSLIGS